MSSSLPAGKVVRFGEKDFNFSFPTTGAAMVKGLSDIDSLEGFDGMLFDFFFETAIIMTPRGLRFPIEIAFLSHAGIVEEIFYMEPSLMFNVEATKKVRYALEAPVGFFDTQGISVGSKLSFNQE